MAAGYQLVLVGSGFASTFFLQGWLSRAPRDSRVLVLERGPKVDHAFQLRNVGLPRAWGRESFTNRTPEKPWVYSLGFGGGSQCWWGCTPRMLPADFRTGSLYGVGVDWPVGYDELEPYYTEVERRMQIAGPAATPWPMSKPYPLPPHRLQAPDKVLAEHFPGLVIAQPTARASADAGRGICCNNGVCGTCPVDAKFTILNGMPEVYSDPRVTLTTGANVTEVLWSGNTATGLVYETKAGPQRVQADLVGLGANAIMNPWLLLRSGIDHGPVGLGLTEQRSQQAHCILADVDGYGGGTALTALAYLFADGPFRSERAACIVETSNEARVHFAPGQWRRRWTTRFIFEDHPQDQNKVSLDPDAPDKPLVEYHGPSAYLQRSSDHLQTWAQELLAPLTRLPVWVNGGLTGTESHVLCTHRMGNDPATSVVDADLVHHRIRNLLVLGGGSFPHAPPANPTLTLSALALRAAERLA